LETLEMILAYSDQGFVHPRSAPVDAVVSGERNNAIMRGGTPFTD